MVLLLLAAGCGPQPRGPEIHDAWVRAVPPASGATAAYFTLENHGPGPLSITGASSPLAPRVEIHEMQQLAHGEHQGAHRMRKVDTLTVAPGEAVRFETGSYHLMLMEMEEAPREGETVQICLQPDKGEALCHDFPVRSGAGGHHH